MIGCDDEDARGASYIALMSVSVVSNSSDSVLYFSLACSRSSAEDNTCS